MLRKSPRAHPRQKYIAARAFYLTFLFISALATWSLIKTGGGEELNGSGKSVLLPRNGGFTFSAVEDDLTITHRAEEVGGAHPLISYIQSINFNTLVSSGS